MKIKSGGRYVVEGIKAVYVLIGDGIKDSDGKVYYPGVLYYMFDPDAKYYADEKGRVRKISDPNNETKMDFLIRYVLTFTEDGIGFDVDSHIRIVGEWGGTPVDPTIPGSPVSPVTP